MLRRATCGAGIHRKRKRSGAVNVRSADKPGHLDEKEFTRDADHAVVGDHKVIRIRKCCAAVLQLDPQIRQLSKITVGWRGECSRAEQATRLNCMAIDCSIFESLGEFLGIVHDTEPAQGVGMSERVRHSPHLPLQPQWAIGCAYRNTYRSLALLMRSPMSSGLSFDPPPQSSTYKNR